MRTGGVPRPAVAAAPPPRMCEIGRRRARAAEEAMTAPDPITVSVIQHRLTGIVEEMGEAMLRTAFSQILNSSRDFSTAICGADAQLVAQAEHIPVHVGALQPGAKAERRSVVSGRRVSVRVDLGGRRII